MIEPRNHNQIFIFKANIYSNEIIKIAEIKKVKCNFILGKLK